MFSGEVAEKTSVFSYRMIIVKKMLLFYNCHITYNCRVTLRDKNSYCC